MCPPSDRGHVFMGKLSKQWIALKSSHLDAEGNLLFVEPGTESSCLANASLL